MFRSLTFDTGVVCIVVICYQPLTFRISGVMVSVLASSEVLCGLKSQSDQNKDYKIDICCFSAALKSRERVKTGCLGIRIIC